VRAWAEGWWNLPVSIGNEVGRIIGADPETVVMHQNVSICQSLILSCLLPLPENSRRRKIVYSELNFPSVMYVYEAHARAHQLRIETVKSDDGIAVPLERMLAATMKRRRCADLARVFKSASRMRRRSASGHTKSAPWWCWTPTSRRARCHFA
jgi:kynureninase